MGGSGSKNPRITFKMNPKISNLKIILGFLESKEGEIVTSLDYREILKILKVNRNLNR